MALALLLSAATADARPKTSFVPSAHPAKEVKRWQRHHRWVDKFKPFIYPDGSRWAAPWPVAMCESHEDYGVGPSGAYGLIAPFFPQYMSPREQDETAHREIHNPVYGSQEAAVYQLWRKWEIEQGCPYF